MLEAAILVVGAIYVLATLVADTAFSPLNPRIRHRGSNEHRLRHPSNRAARAGAGRAPPSAARSWATSSAGKAFIVGAVILLFCMFCAIFPGALAAAQPVLRRNLWPSTSRRRARTGSAPPARARHVRPRDRGPRDYHDHRAAGDAAGARIVGTAIGLVMGYFGGVVDDVISRFVEAFLALPLVVVGILGVVALGSSNVTLIIVIGIVFSPLIARTVRAAVLQERGLDYVSAARLRGESSLYIMFVEILPNVMAPIVVEFTVRLGYAVFTLVSLSFPGSGCSRRRRTGAPTSAANYVVVDGRLLVGGPVRRARDRNARDRRQHDRQLDRIGPGGLVSTQSDSPPTRQAQPLPPAEAV